MVDEPRLTAWYGTTGFVGPGLPPVVREMAASLSGRYDRKLDGVGAALYRDGHDSVAWHGDRIALEVVDPVVALVSLGSPRTLRMRSTGQHGDTRTFRLAPGDLFVMGGSSQRTWEHAIPKVARAGPRLSLQFRHSR
jgi:alkylated DNA repair dioxygenase AlkB